VDYGGPLKLAPVGVIVTGRILRMEHQLVAMEKNVRLPKAFLLIIASDTLEVNGASSPFYAILVRPAPSRVQTGNPKLDAWPHGTFVFPARDPRNVVQVPFESHWRTAAAPALR